MKFKIVLVVAILFLISSCGTESTGDVSFGPGGEPGIIEKDKLEATVDTESWRGELTSVEFSTDGSRETVTVVAERTFTPEKSIGQAGENIVISISSNDGELLMEQEYSGSNIEITYKEEGANLPDELWVSSSGTANIVELSDFNIQVRFNAALRLQKDLDEGNTSGDILFIEDGKFNKSLDDRGDVPVERVVISD